MLTGSENDWEVIESGLAIGYHDAFAGHSMVRMTQHLEDKGFAQVGVSWDGVGIVGLYDWFVANEAMSHLGLNRTQR
jgi:hypothetical protein